MRPWKNVTIKAGFVKWLMTLKHSSKEYEKQRKMERYKYIKFLLGMFPHQINLQIQNNRIKSHARNIVHRTCSTRRIWCMGYKLDIQYEKICCYECCQIKSFVCEDGDAIIHKFFFYWTVHKHRLSWQCGNVMGKILERISGHRRTFGRSWIRSNFMPWSFWRRILSCSIGIWWS